jgi:glucokinase
MGAPNCVIGFDMGGTKMLASVLDNSYQAISTAKKRTPPGADNDKVLDVVVATVGAALEEAGIKPGDVAAIGIAVPGPIDRDAGRIVSLTNVGVRDMPLRDQLSAEFGIPVVLENDVNAGTFGEFVAGAAKGYRNVLGVFPGTGVGGGIIIDGTLYRGHTGRAGEIGHMIVEVGGRLCGCGKYGCLEAVSSRTAIAKELVHLAAIGEAPTVLERAGTDITQVKSGVIKKAIGAGEKSVIRVVERAAWYLGVGLGSCLDIFDPDVVVLGGGLVEKLGDSYLESVEASMREHNMIGSKAPLVRASLGDDSVIVGSAALALAEIHETPAAESSDV